MPVKIRLQRKGKKGQPFYHIVIADGRAPRDGKFIERIGTYNPLRKPAEIKINFDKAIQWLGNGAQPTDTVRAILSYKGVIYKAHLLKGVAKGALTMDQAEAKFQVWLQDKEAKIAAKAKEGILSKKEASKKKVEAEKKVNEERAQELAKKRLQMMQKAEKQAEAEKHEEIPAEEVPEAAIPEAAATETAVPEAAAPEAAAPEAAVPEAAVPEAAAPEAAAPEATEEKAE